jgi:hypothetical protein
VGFRPKQALYNDYIFFLNQEDRAYTVNIYSTEKEFVMQATQLLTRRSLDQLETDIISLSSHINSMEYEFLVLLREFDLRQGWKAYHFNHCSEWLNMKCGMAPGTAREKLRVANALFDLPQTSTAFAKGELSYSKARALSRIATPTTEEHLLDFALKTTAASVDRHCMELRNVQRHTSTKDANRLYENRYLSCSAHSDGSVTLSVELAKESADLVMKALEMASSQSKDKDVYQDNEGEEYANAPRGASELLKQQADALVEVAKSFLAGGNDKKTCTADHYQVTVHVDESALRRAPDENSKSDLPVETVRRLCCDSSLVISTDDDSGKTKDLSRKHRVVHPSLRRKLLSRDKGCRFPGCTHEKWLDAHHIVHWADGGETTAENLVMLCSKHHRLLHEGGFEIKPGANGQWHFRNASGLKNP